MGIGWIRWVCLLGFLAAILIGAKALWDSKRAPYFILREEAATRAQWVALIALVLLVANVSLLIWRKPEPLPAVKIIPTSIPATLPRSGLSPRTGPSTNLGMGFATLVPILTPAPACTSSPAGPTYTRQVPTLTPRPSTLTLTTGSDPSFEVITLAQDVSDENLPLAPGDAFPKGTNRVYAFFTYREMERAVPWTQARYREEEEVWRQTSLWRRGREGIAWTYMEFNTGFPSGGYEVRLYITHKLQQRAKFTVQ